MHAGQQAMLSRSPGAVLASTVASGLPVARVGASSKRVAVLVAACASLALACTVMVLSSAQGPVSLKSNDDLSIFADSSVSFYEPGDTAADSDILPRQVLADDGSSTDREESTRKHAEVNYADSHWYTAGQSKDVHGDLQQENTAREQRDRRKMAHQQQLQEQEHEAWIKREQQRAVQAEQVQLQQRRRAAVQQLREQRRQHAEEAEHSASGSSPLSYKAMRSRLANKDAAVRKTAMRESYAYQHPFATGKKGMQNLVMAEFKQDENKMKATTNAIFGSKKAHNHQWRHGGLLLSDASHPDTLHDAMKRQRATVRMEEKARAQQLAQERPVQGGAVEAKAARKAHAVPLGCTIEQLENGGCSHVSEKYQKATHKAAGKGPVATGKATNLKSADVVQPGQAPTAGTVISGWAKNVGSWF